MCPSPLLPTSASAPSNSASTEGIADPGRSQPTRFRRISQWVTGRPCPNDASERLQSDLVVGFALAFLAFGAVNLLGTQLLLPLPEASVVLSRWTTALFMLGLLGALAGLRMGASVRASAHGICSSSVLVVLGSTFAHGGIDSPVLVLWVVLPQMAGILAGRSAAIAWASLLTLALPAMHLFEQVGWIQPVAVPPANYVPSLFVNLATGCAAATCLAVLHDRINLGLRASLEDERRKLRHAAGHDPLTELANRRLFEEMQEVALRRANRTKQQVALFVIDLDDFKEINDRHGHAAGDRLLRGVADRLREFARVTDSIARLGGDEFAVLVELIDSGAAAHVVADRMAEALAFRIELGGDLRAEVSASIGVALYPTDADTRDRLHEAADTAMYAAKNAGGGCHRFFSDRAGRS